MKTEYVGIRLTKQEKDLLKTHASNNNFSITDYIRYCTLIIPSVNKLENNNLNVVQINKCN